jgi:hypothetical protein
MDLKNFLSSRKKFASSISAGAFLSTIGEQNRRNTRELLLAKSTGITSSFTPETNRHTALTV